MAEKKKNQSDKKAKPAVQQTKKAKHPQANKSPRKPKTNTNTNPSKNEEPAKTRSTTDRAPKRTNNGGTSSRSSNSPWGTTPPLSKPPDTTRTSRQQNAWMTQKWCYLWFNFCFFVELFRIFQKRFNSILKIVCSHNSKNLFWGYENFLNFIFSHCNTFIKRL